MTSKSIRFARQLFMLWFIYRISCEIVELTNFPIPGNVVGVFLLFGLLSIGVIKLEHIREGADFLLKHLVFFFIPLTVGLMNWGHIFYKYGIELALAVIISTLLPFWTVGYLIQFLSKKEKKCRI